MNAKKYRKKVKRNVKKVDKLKSQDWYKWKSRQLRSNHLARLKKVAKGDYKDRMVEVPTAVEFEAWLKVPETMTCYYCAEFIDRDKLEVDHKQPVSREGSFGFDNLAKTNKLNNKAKGSLTEAEYKSLLDLLATWDSVGSWNVLSRLIQSSIVYKRRKK